MVTISSKLGVEDALQRLDRLLAGAREAQSLAGKRDGRAFSVRRAQRLGKGILRPQLSGIIEPTEAGCALKGEFGLCRKARICLRSWFALGGLWTVASILVGFRMGPHSMWLLPAVGVAMILIGAVSVQFATSYYNSDREWLVKLLSEELGS
jgi:hypothetical protein